MTPPGPFLSNSTAIADHDHKGHEEGPFTIWGSAASTKAQVSANRRSAGLSLLLCGRATAGTVTLATWPSPLDLTVALEDREWAVPCADSGDSIGNGIDYCSMDMSTCECVCVLARARPCVSVANRWNELMALNYGDKMDVVWLCWVFWMIHGDDKHLLPLGVKYKVYTVPLVPLSQLHLTPLPCGGQRGF